MVILIVKSGLARCINTELNLTNYVCSEKHFILGNTSDTNVSDISDGVYYVNYVHRFMDTSSSKPVHVDILYGVYKLFVEEDGVWEKYKLWNTPYDKDISSIIEPIEKYLSMDSIDGGSDKGDNFAFSIGYSISTPTIQKDGFWVDDNNWKLLVMTILDSENAVLVGDSGWGKTHLARIAYEKLREVYPDWSYNKIMMTMDDPVDLISHMYMDNGSFVYEKSILTESLPKPGVILFDEINRTNAKVINSLIPVLDDDRKLYTNMSHPSIPKMVERHENCAIIATMNVGSKFVGTSEIDDAIKNRFTYIDVTPPPYKAQSAILMNRVPDISKSDCKTIVDFCMAVQSESRIKSKPAMREMIKMGRKTLYGVMSTKDLIREMTLPKYNKGRYGSSSERDIINAIIDKI